MPAPLRTGDDTDSPNPNHALLDFLQFQSERTLSRLYETPSSCLSIYRLLGPLERQLIMNLLWLESAIPATIMLSWVTQDGKRAYDEALGNLNRLHIVARSSTKLSLNATFKTSFRQAITGGGTTSSFGVPAGSESGNQPPTVEVLDAFALERWETILHFMVSSGSGQSPSRPSASVLRILQQKGLMASEHGGVPQITSAGFQFLLDSPHTQLWSILLQYLQTAEGGHQDLVEILSFLFMLSTMDLGREYSMAKLKESQKRLLEDLRDYGLVWQRKKDSHRFSPTRLATTLTSSLPPLPSSKGTSAGSDSEGFIVLETNYRVYAYTDNPLQTAVMNLFMSLKYRFPNLVVGSITRESVRKALANGISAEQILAYLTAHAHPQMRKNKPLLPVTVQDQIRLWELERNRVKSQDGYLYHTFASQQDYEMVLNYAKELNVVIWENATSRRFVASPEGHANIKGFIDRRNT